MANDVLNSIVPNQKTTGTGANTSIFSRDMAPSQRFTKKDIDSVPALQAALQKLEDETQSFVGSLMGKGLLWENIQAQSWNLNYPYVLKILRLDTIEFSSNSARSKADLANIGNFLDKKPDVSAEKDMKAKNYTEVASFKLPINPQDLVISTPFAIKTTITSRGVTEEHSGVRTKNIVINGTTGFYMDKPVNPGSINGGSSLGTIFASTIDTFGQLQSQASVLFGGTGTTKNNNPDAQSNNTHFLTGYYQYHILRMVLEHYAEMKAHAADGSAYRLALSIPKDGVVYLVTPNNFVTKKSVASPMEYNYTLQMTAWATIHNDASVSTDTIQTLGKGNSLSTFQKILNSITQARKTINTFKNLISSVQSDIQGNIIGPISQLALLAKDIQSIPAALSDLPSNLSHSLNNSLAQLASSFSSIDPKTQKALALISSTSIFNPNTSTGGNAGVKILSASTSTPSDLASQGSLASQAAANYLKEIIAPGSTSADSINFIDLNPSPSQISAYNDAVSKAYTITQNDIQTLINNLTDTTKKLEPIITSLPPTTDEWQILYNLQDTIATLTASLATNIFASSANEAIQQTTTPALSLNAIDYWSAATTANNINFTAPTSKYQIPFPFRASLEDVASQYLGDPTRWIEIAALNGLEYPYIDETGQYVPLIANGTGNTVALSSDLNLFVGQTVFVSSNSQGILRANVLAIYKISNAHFSLLLDTSVDMSVYKTSDSATLQYYLPHTVNSLKKIWIPSNQQTNYTDLGTKTLTLLNEDIDLVKFSLIDLLLDSSNDLAIASDGFANLAFGTTNLIQAAKFKMMTTAGSLQLHQDYGAAIDLGTNVAEINIDQIMQNISNSFKKDSRFKTPSQISINNDASVMSITVDATVSQQGQSLPITFPLS